MDQLPTAISENGEMSPNRLSSEMVAWRGFQATIPPVVVSCAPFTKKNPMRICKLPAFCLILLAWIAPGCARGPTDQSHYPIRPDRRLRVPRAFQGITQSESSRQRLGERANHEFHATTNAPAHLGHDGIECLARTRSDQGSHCSGPNRREGRRGLQGPRRHTDSRWREAALRVSKDGGRGHPRKACG